MGLTRTPEIAESIEQRRERIERSLNFLCKLLGQGEQVTLEIVVTNENVTLNHVEDKITMIA